MNLIKLKISFARAALLMFAEIFHEARQKREFSRVERLIWILARSDALASTRHRRSVAHHSAREIDKSFRGD